MTGEGAAVTDSYVGDGDNKIVKLPGVITATAPH